MKQKRKSGKFKIAIILVIVVFLSVFWFFYLKKNIQTQFYLHGKSHIYNNSLEIINKAASDSLPLDLKYTDFILIEKDNEGNVSFMQGKTMEINRLARKLALDCQKVMMELSPQAIEIPIGAFTGSVLLANYGRKINIPITILPNVTASYFTTFNSVGINQTRHSIFIKINVIVDMVIPLVHSPVDFDTYIMVAESVIVGKIPDVYIDSLTSTDLLDLIP